MDAAGSDPEIMRGLVDISSLLARPDEVLNRPGLFDRVMAHAETPAEPRPGPSRAELVELIRSA
jgi:hypothetical protein